MTLICSLVTLRIYTVSPAYANISEKSINAAVYLYPVFEISGLIQKFSFAFYRNTLISISANDREINGKFYDRSSARQGVGNLESNKGPFILLP